MSETQNHRRSWLGWLPLGLFFTIWIAAFAYGQSANEGNSDAPASVATAIPAGIIDTGTIATMFGELSLPADVFIDGRQLDVQPPFTINEIIFWDELTRDTYSCYVEHGLPARVESAQYIPVEERFYFYGSSDGCTGWVAENFLSLEQHPAVGQLQP